jgi:hypothetical protein
MCHCYNSQNGIKDCSRSNQYHNKEFKKTAERFGLNVEKDASRGFSNTSLKPKTLEYIASLNLIAFDLYRLEKNKDNNNDEKKPSSTKKFVCSICKTSIRATKEVRVICGDCNILLIPA